MTINKSIQKLLAFFELQYNCWPQGGPETLSTFGHGPDDAYQFYVPSHWIVSAGTSSGARSEADTVWSAALWGLDGMFNYEYTKSPILINQLYIKNSVPFITIKIIKQLYYIVFSAELL